MSPETPPVIPNPPQGEVDPSAVAAAQTIVNEAPAQIPPMPEASAPAEAPAAPAAPSVEIGPPPAADPAQAAAELQALPQLVAPAPKPAEPLRDPNLPEQKQQIKITTIEGN